MSKTLQTPQQVDEHLAVLYMQQEKNRSALVSAMTNIYHDAGARKQYFGHGRGRYTSWSMEWNEALEKVADLSKDKTYIGRQARMAQDRYAQALKAIATKRDEILEAEKLYTDWSRFFLVTSSNGHIHRSMSCSTCRPTTTYGWLPNLSGKTMAEAIAFFGPAAECLCSVCFPDAPVAKMDGNLTQKQTNALLKGETPEAKKAHCPGSGQRMEEPSRTGYAYGNWGTCPHCKEHVALNGPHGPIIRKHPVKP